MNLIFLEFANGRGYVNADCVEKLFRAERGDPNVYRAVLKSGETTHVRLMPADIRPHDPRPLRGSSAATGEQQ